MMDITAKELLILKRFLKPKIIETKEEERVLDEFRSIGWVMLQMKSSVKINGVVKVIPVAKLNVLGRQFVKRELILQNPFWRFFYRLINLPAN